ncbi:hypothetical protein ACRW5D_00005, partial [Escherichia coli]
SHLKIRTSVRHISKPISYFKIHLLSGISGGQLNTKDEDIAEMPELASTVTSMPAYTSKALVIDTTPIEKEISNIISHNGQL